MDVLRPLGQEEMGPAGDFQHLARSREDLARDEKRDELLRDFPEIEIAPHQIIFVTAVGVPHRIGVVLENINLADKAFFAQALLRHRQAGL